jgi:hypothetical protein
MSIFSNNVEKNNGFFDDVYCSVIINFSGIYNPPINYDNKDKILRDDDFRELIVSGDNYADETVPPEYYTATEYYYLNIFNNLPEAIKGDIINETNDITDIIKIRNIINKYGNVYGNA